MIILFAAFVTFAVYTCMYGYRKAFTAAGYNHLSFLGIDYKVWLVSAQVLGYMCSKFYGIKFIAEAGRSKRSTVIVVLILSAWIALLLFALVPAPYNIPFMFLNGFPLGMIWGLVFSFVEGRRATEFMGAVLASSFIFASGFAKTIGVWLMQDMGVPAVWMPFMAGAIYLLPLLLFTSLLEAIPAPTQFDMEQRCERKPMNKQHRSYFLRTFAPGLVALIIGYILLTILRDFRDNFAPEILGEVGLGSKAALFTQTETLVAIAVLLVVSLLMFIKSNYKAFYFNHIIIVAGLGLAGLSTLLFNLQFLSGFAWYLCIGTGLYMAYIPINCLYFDRMIATFRLTANVGFVMYVADSFGYLGSVLVLFVKEFSGFTVSWVHFYTWCLYIATTVGILCTLYALGYYRRLYRNSPLLLKMANA